jgi:hypothetical protein
VRTLALATLVNTIGNGVFFTLSALYFTRIVGFSVVEVGTGLSIAAGVAIAAGIPIGHLADRRGPREVLVVLVLLTGAMTGLMLLVTQWWQFVLVATLVAVVDRGANAVRSALIAGVVRGSDRAGAKAYLRSITNVGMTAGAGIAAFALHVDTAGAYRAVLWVDVGSYVLAAVVLLRVAHVPPTPAGTGGGMLTALRDLPFVAVVAVNSVLVMHYWILEIALPLWVVEHTRAPHALVAGLLVVNTVVVVVAQVAVAKRVATVATAVRATVVSGVLFLLACALFGTTGSFGPTLAAVVLVAASLVHVAGELCQAAASFVLGFELPPDHAMGQYQGVWGMGFAIASFAAPTAMALLPLALGLTGWLILGAVLLAAALLTRPVVAWAVRSRDPLIDSAAPTPR